MTFMDSESIRIARGRQQTFFFVPEFAANIHPQCGISKILSIHITATGFRWRFRRRSPFAFRWIIRFDPMTARHRITLLLFRSDNASCRRIRGIAGAAARCLRNLCGRPQLRTIVSAISRSPFTTRKSLSVLIITLAILCTTDDNEEESSLLF